MKNWKIILPVATIAIGFWACGEESTTAADNECTSAECIAAQIDSLNKLMPLDSTQQNPLDPNQQNPLDPNQQNPQDPNQQNPLDPNQQNPQDPNNPVSSSSIVPVSSSDTTAVPGTESSSSHTHWWERISSEAGSSDAEPAESSSSATITPPNPASDFVEDHRSECNIGNIPTSINNAKLPNPFEGLDGKVISSKSEWKCRREEIGAMYEKIMFGTKPRNPEKVEGSYSGGKFTVKVTDKGKSGSFSVTISGAGTKDNPKPAIIGFGGGFMGNSCGSLGGALSGLDVAQIIFNPDNVAPESGGGMFYTVNSGSDAGTIMAWAWGVSRLIDALETTPEAGIDVKHLAITGCSRWGKGSLAVGAFDERIALTIPQESGSGGASLWRVGAQVNRQKGKQFVQGLNSAGTEGRWMKTSFKNYDGKENTLPFDQHMLVSMVAPRALLILDNAGQEWLGEVPSNYCGQASLETFKALGITENYTYSQQGGHAHCSLPNQQFDEVKDFVDKFLLGKDAKTGKIDYTQNTQTINFVRSEWIDWETPNLN